MVTLTATLVTTNPVRCPVCHTQLVGRGIWVVDSVAFCHDCARLCTLPALGLEIDCALGCELVTSWARVHGILLYNPVPATPTGTTAAEQLWQQSAFPYVITEHDLRHANQREDDPAAQIVPQALPAYRPRNRRSPTLFEDQPTP